MNTEKVMEVLSRVEWVGSVGARHRYCSCCDRWEKYGHYSDCKLGALLREGEKEEAGAGKWSHEELYIKALEAVVRTVRAWIRLVESAQTRQAMEEFREALGMVDKAKGRYWVARTAKEER